MVSALVHLVSSYQFLVWLYTEREEESAVIRQLSDGKNLNGVDRHAAKCKDGADIRWWRSIKLDR